MTDREKSTDPLIRQAARDWIARLASGDISEAELVAYRRWATDPAHEAVFQHELALWRSLGAIGDRLAPREKPAPAAPAVLPKSRRRWGHAGGAIAACIAIMLVAPDAMLLVRADHRTDVAVQSIALPDGSRAVLDAGSAIALHFDGTQRRVDLLKGRAWFDVVHDKRVPFRVAANGGVVEDVGTAFEVASDGDTAEAAVTSGEVRALSPEEARPGLLLHAGQRARWSTGGAPARAGDVPTSRIAAWRQGDILLDSVAVRAAVHEIGRYRTGPTFVMGDVDALPPVTAIIRADRPDEGLRALAASSHLQILHLPGGIAVVRPAS